MDAFSRRETQEAFVTHLEGNDRMRAQVRHLHPLPTGVWVDCNALGPKGEGQREQTDQREPQHGIQRPKSSAKNPFFFSSLTSMGHFSRMASASVKKA